MTAKEYLSQAYWLDRRIDSKLEQISSLRAMVTKTTSFMNDTPVSHTRNVHSMEDVIAKIIDMENQLNEDIDSLVDLKQDIMQRIKEIESPEYQTILELRYLCFKPWEDIAAKMGFGINNIFKLHAKALKFFKVPETLQ